MGCGPGPGASTSSSRMFACAAGGATPPVESCKGDFAEGIRPRLVPKAAAPAAPPSDPKKPHPMPRRDLAAHSRLHPHQKGRQKTSLTDDTKVNRGALQLRLGRRLSHWPGFSSCHSWSALLSSLPHPAAVRSSRESPPLTILADSDSRSPLDGDDRWNWYWRRLGSHLGPLGRLLFGLVLGLQRLHGRSQPFHWHGSVHV